MAMRPRIDAIRRMPNGGDVSGQLDSYDLYVLGGGISGLTTALVLQALGFSVAILTEQAPGSARHGPHFDIGPGDGRNRLRVDPRIATGYAMASAYPHNLRIANLPRISDESQAVFNELARRIDSGVSRYRMFEVFEQEPEEAALASRRMKFQLFDGKPVELKRAIDPPARPEAAYLWGWTFETYFANMPVYLRFLWSLFLEQGGLVKPARLSPESVLELPAGRPVVNCLGLGAIEVFGDASPATIVRGRQVLVPGAPRLAGQDTLPLAYNYTPPPELFTRADGSAEYVHFFPRSDGWVLGQTREPGTLDDQGQWRGAAVCSPELLIGDQLVPSPIVELNESLLSAWLGHNLQDRPLVARQGYRYYRDPSASGVRLEAETRQGKLLVHNYGHGGSGITMSWGCALEAARLILIGAGLKTRASRAGNDLAHVVLGLLREPSD